MFAFAHRNFENGYLGNAKPPHLFTFSRRVANGEQVERVAGLAMKNRPSANFAGYWQRHRAA